MTTDPGRDAAVSAEDLALDLAPVLRDLAGEMGFAPPPHREVLRSLAPCPNPDLGDWALSAAMRLAKSAKRPPMELAERIAAGLDGRRPAWLGDVAVAKPGFVNLRIAKAFRLGVVSQVLRQGDRFGRAPEGSLESVLVEYVSANPTGPLHLGHGRNAILGDAIGRLLRASGRTVAQEYYVNDAGRQMQVFGMSLWLRWLGFAAPPRPGPKPSGDGGAKPGEGPGPVRPGQLPRLAYRGEYVADMAEDFGARAAPEWRIPASGFQVAPQEDPERELQAHLDACRAQLGNAAFARVCRIAADLCMERIQGELKAVGVEMDSYRHEAQLLADGAVRKALDALEAAGAVERRDGAVWLRSKGMGDDKDRVLVRSSGEATYFAADLAYHLDKISRGHQRLIDVWGADHHGYVARMQLGIQALNRGESPLQVVLVQLVSLLENGSGVSMSKRAGAYVTLAELRQRIGTDALRYFYLAQGADRQQEVDVELATRQSTENPVYYLQYAHARLCSVEERYEEEHPGEDWAGTAGDPGQLGAGLGADAADELLRLMDEYPRALRAAADDLAPQRLVHYLNRLAAGIHSWYKGHKVVGEPPPRRQARMCLGMAARQVLANGLGLLGIRAPRTM